MKKRLLAVPVTLLILILVVSFFIKGSPHWLAVKEVRQHFPKGAGDNPVPFNPSQPCPQGSTCGPYTPKPTDPPAKVDNGFSLSDIVGSVDIMLQLNHIIGGYLVSPANGLVIPTLDALNGDAVYYTMGAGDSVDIYYTPEPAYAAGMTDGVVADVREVSGKKKSKFTLAGNDGLLKIKATAEPSYEFMNGFFQYENDKMREYAFSEKQASVTLDKEYETGFKCLKMPQGAYYSYIDKTRDDRSFSIVNNNSQEYKLCIKKSVYDEFEMKEKLSGYVDLISSTIRLNAKMAYLENNQTVYESMSTNNVAEIQSTMEGKKLSLSMKPEIKGVIAATYSGYHVITEESVKGKVTRYHQYSKEVHPDSIGIYSSPTAPDIKIEGLALSQQGGVGKFTALSPSSEKQKDCEKKLKEALSYSTNVDVR